MKVLLDSCVAGTVADDLRGLGHDVNWTGSWKADPGDREILAFAQNERRVLVTLDKDFGEFAVLEGSPHAGIVRLVDLPISTQAARCHAVLEAHAKLLAEGGIITVEPGRVRLRPP